MNGHDDEAIQKAWNMMSMHNSELLIENYELKERIQRMSVWGLIKAKVRNLFRGENEYS
jgi:hypothetical protein